VHTWQGSALFSVAPCQNRWQWAQTGTQEIHPEHQETILCCAGAGTLAQRDCPERLCCLLLEDLHKSLHECKHPALDDSAWTGVEPPEVPSSFNPSVILFIGVTKPGIPFLLNRVLADICYDHALRSWSTYTQAVDFQNQSTFGMKPVKNDCIRDTLG